MYLEIGESEVDIWLGEKWVNEIELLEFFYRMGVFGVLEEKPPCLTDEDRRIISFFEKTEIIETKQDLQEKKLYRVTKKGEQFIQSSYAMASVKISLIKRGKCFLD